nr:unnamed protein product [Digitaria exilis]
MSLPVDPFFSFGPNAFSRSFSSFSMAFFLFSSLEVLASAGLALATRNVVNMADDMNDKASLRVIWFLNLLKAAIRSLVLAQPFLATRRRGIEGTCRDAMAVVDC